MFKIAALILEVTLYVIFVSQILIPAIIPNVRYFWLFRKYTYTKNDKSPDLSEKISNAKLEANELKEKVKEIKDEANNDLSKAQELKNKSNNII